MRLKFEKCVNKEDIIDLVKKEFNKTNPKGNSM